MPTVSRVILVFDSQQQVSGTGYLLAPRLAVTAAHVAQSGPPHISVLTSERVETLQPGQFRSNAVAAQTVTPYPGADMALLEFEESFAVPAQSRIVMTEPGQTRGLVVRLKGYPSVLSTVNQTRSSFVPVFAETRVVIDQMHGGGSGAFALRFDELFAEAEDYKGMSGAVLTYLDEPLAVQHQAWPGPPAMLEFRRLDLLSTGGEARTILSRHRVATWALPTEAARLYPTEEPRGAEPDPLPVPIVAVPTDLIDVVRTRDLTA